MERKLQKVFKGKYVDKLRKSIVVDNYLGEEFPYDSSEVKFLANVYQPEGLEDKLIANLNNEYEQGIALFEAFPGLTPLVATQSSFWTYLTHVDLFKYTQKRWPDLVEGKFSNREEKESYILDHWFRSPNGVMRTTLANLWWSVYCSIDDSASVEHKYDLTKVLFSRTDFRVRRLGTSTLMRHKEAVLGILNFVKDNESFMDVYFEGRAIYIAKYFNNLGGSKPLAYFKRDYFYNELVKHKDDMAKIFSRADIVKKRNSK